MPHQQNQNPQDLRATPRIPNSDTLTAEIRLGTAIHPRTPHGDPVFQISSLVKLRITTINVTFPLQCVSVVEAEVLSICQVDKAHYPMTPADLTLVEVLKHSAHHN